jgi:hypothetical protein
VNCVNLRFPKEKETEKKKDENLYYLKIHENMKMQKIRFRE